MHNEGEVNPIRDMEIITNELFQKDLQHIAKAMEELDRLIARKNLKPDQEEKACLMRVKEMLENK